MELKSKFAIYFGIILSVIMLLSLIFKSRSKSKYGGGKKTTGIKYSKDESYFKAKMVQYKILKLFVTMLFILTILTYSIMLSRPYKNKITTSEIYNRDIMLCMDISSSVDDVNVELVDKLKETVKNLNGDRVGIMIFNTSPVLISPLTDDYDYICEQLDLLKESLQYRIDGMQGKSYNESMTLLDFISEGTVVDAETIGSSLIGDGLASSVYNFTDLDSERSRVIIFSTDNDLYGEQTFTLQEAADLCASKKITVFSIGIENMPKDKKDELEQAALSTGGKMYIAEDNSLKNIINDIEKTSKSVMKTDTKSQEIMIVKTPFILMLISTFLLFVFCKMTRL